jgi:hypothetical protein
MVALDGVYERVAKAVGSRLNAEVAEMYYLSDFLIPPGKPAPGGVGGAYLTQISHGYGPDWKPTIVVLVNEPDSWPPHGPPSDEGYIDGFEFRGDKGIGELRWIDVEVYLPGSAWSGSAEVLRRRGRLLRRSS